MLKLIRIIEKICNWSTSLISRVITKFFFFFFLFTLMTCILLNPIKSHGNPKNLYFPPSSSQVETVILSHTWEYNDPRNNLTVNGRKITDPRLKLIEDISHLFPDLGIIVNATMSSDEFYKSYPDLKGKIKKVISYTNHSIQDAFEFAYDELGKLVVLNTGYMSNEKVREFFPKALLSRISTDYSEPAFKAWRSSSERFVRYAGGNIEFLLDGTPLLGKNIPKEVYDWFKDQFAEVLTVDSAWNSSGDLDEIFLITSDPLSKNDCIVFYLDVLAGRKILIQSIDLLQRQGVWMSLPEETRNSLNSYLHQSTIADELQKTILKDLKNITSQKSMKNCRAQAIPQLYTESFMDPVNKDLILKNNFKTQIAMTFGNQLNSLVINSHIFLLESSFQPQQNAVESIYRKNGFTVHTYTPNGFDSGGGQMHCSTNTIRKNRNQNNQ